jgi:hypothetical protein
MAAEVAMVHSEVAEAVAVLVLVLVALAVAEEME